MQMPQETYSGSIDYDQIDEVRISPATETDIHQHSAMKNLLDSQIAARREVNNSALQKTASPVKGILKTTNSSGNAYNTI